MLEHKYMYHSSEQFLGFKNKSDSTKKDIGYSLGKRYHVVNQTFKSENKRNKYMKTLKKQNKIICSMTNKTVSCKKLRKIKIIYIKKINNYDYFSSFRSRIEFDYSLSYSDSE